MIDMSPAELDRRLREVARLAARQDIETPTGPPSIEQSVQTGMRPMVDMSDQGIDRRLREVADLRDLCLQLGQLRPF